MGSSPPPSEPDKRISRIRLSSWWVTSSRIDRPFGGSGQDSIPANGTENLRDWSPVALKSKAVNMHMVCAVSACHALISWLSPICLALGHSHRSVFCQPHVNASTSLRSLRSRPITALPRYYGRSDSCPPGSSALPSMNSSSCYGQVSLIHAPDLPIPPSPTTGQALDIAFARYPSARRVPHFPGLGFTFRQQARRRRPAESSSLSYGWIVHLLLLPTPPHGDAVAVGYRPESVYLKRTSTSPIKHAFRRTGSRCPSGDISV